MTLLHTNQPVRQDAVGTRLKHWVASVGSRLHRLSLPPSSLLARWSGGQSRANLADAAESVPLPAEATGREVYIVGGGPSLKELDLSVLADKAVIAVNYSIFTVPNAMYFMTLDPRFFTKIKDRLHEFNTHPATKVLVHNWPTDRVKVRQDGLTVGPTGTDFSAFRLIIRSTVAAGFGRSFLDFRNGVNSGYCALQFALLLGYEKIHLLGFDLTDAGGAQHFHDAYQLDPNCLPSYIRYFRDGLKQLAADWPNVQVISHSPVSVLNDLIPYRPLNEEPSPATDAAPVAVG